MMKKREDGKDLFQTIGEKNGVPTEEVRKEIEKAIREGYNNPDPKKQAEFRKRFGEGIPAREEFIYFIQEIKK